MEKFLKNTKYSEKDMITYLKYSAHSKIINIKNTSQFTDGRFINLKAEHKILFIFKLYSKLKIRYRMNFHFI